MSSQYLTVIHLSAFGFVHLIQFFNDRKPFFIFANKVGMELKGEVGKSRLGSFELQTSFQVLIEDREVGKLILFKKRQQIIAIS